MENTLLEHPTILDGLFTDETNSDRRVHTSMDAFLASVEKRAYVIAMASCRDQDTSLDIVQDSMFRMVKSYSNKPAEQWPQLFFKILNNRITDQHRKRGLGRLTQWFGSKTDEQDTATNVTDQLPSEDFGPDTLTNSVELSDAINSALKRLSFKQRQTLLLRLWQGLSVKETAAAMEISEGSVKTHLSRAVHEMRRLLEEYSDHE